MYRYLLRPHAVFEGPRRVTIALRPRRLAYLIDPTDSNLALAAIESASLTWGGQFQFLIPCPPTGQPENPWLTALERHDPDVLIDLVGASEEFRKLQHDRW